MKSRIKYKAMILVGSAILLALAMLNCTALNEEEGIIDTSTESAFEVKGWHIFDDNKSPTLHIEFENNTGSTLELELRDPHGLITGTDKIFSEHIKHATLPLSDPGGTPSPGKYELTVRELMGGRPISTEYFKFRGAEAKISEMEITWDYWARGFYSLADIMFVVKNDGDLPVYISKVDLIFDGKPHSLGPPSNLLVEVILPGSQTTIFKRCGIVEIKPGDYTATLELIDWIDNIICSSSHTVTPHVDIEEQTEFQLTDWYVTEFVGRPTLILKYVLLGNEAYLSLTNPSGVEIDSQKILGGTAEAKFFLVKMTEIPETGQYTLTVRDSLDRIIAEHSLDIDYK